MLHADSHNYFAQDGCCAGFCEFFSWFRPLAGMALGRDFYYIWTTDVSVTRLADLFQHLLEQFMGTAVASTLQYLLLALSGASVCVYVR